MTASRKGALKRAKGDQARGERRLKGRLFSLLVLALIAMSLEGCCLRRGGCRSCSSSRGVYAPIGPTIGEPPLITDAISPDSNGSIIHESAPIPGPIHEGTVLPADAQPPVIQGPYLQGPSGPILSQPPILSAPGAASTPNAAAPSTSSPNKPSLSDPSADVNKTDGAAPGTGPGNGTGGGAGSNSGKGGPAELDAVPLPEPPPPDPQASSAIEPSPLPLPLPMQRLTRLTASSDEASVLPLTSPSRKGEGKPGSPLTPQISNPSRSATKADRDQRQPARASASDAKTVQMSPVPRLTLPDEQGITLTAAQAQGPKTQTASAAKPIQAPSAESAAPGVMRFSALAPDLAAGSLPDSKQLRWLADKGYKTLVDLGDPDAGRHTLIADAAKLGMRYIALPIQPVPAPAGALKRFQNELKSLDARPIYFFDNDGERAGAFWCMHRRLSESVPQAMAEREAAEIGLRDPEILEATRRFVAQTQSPSQSQNGDGFAIPRDRSLDNAEAPSSSASNIQIQAPLTIPPASSNANADADSNAEKVPTVVHRANAGADDSDGWGWKSLGAMTVTMMAIPAAYYGRLALQKIRRAALLTAANPQKAELPSATAPSSSGGSQPV